MTLNTPAKADSLLQIAYQADILAAIADFIAVLVEVLLTFLGVAPDDDAV